MTSLERLNYEERICLTFPKCDFSEYSCTSAVYTP
jgi:hypothetical protein